MLPQKFRKVNNPSKYGQLLANKPKDGASCLDAPPYSYLFVPCSAFIVIYLFKIPRFKSLSIDKYSIIPYTGFKKL